MTYKITGNEELEYISCYDYGYLIRGDGRCLDVRSGNNEFEERIAARWSRTAS